MKKLTAIVLAMLTICMLFTACNEKPNSGIITKPPEDPTPTLQESATPTGNETSTTEKVTRENLESYFEEKYPDKKKIVFVSPYSKENQKISKVTNEILFNEYLDSLGCDFYLYFNFKETARTETDIMSLFEKGEFDVKFLPLYQEALDKTMAEEQVDIIYTGIQHINGVRIRNKPFYENMAKGYFADITEYVKPSPLYEKFPEKYWETTMYNGKIYGINTNMGSFLMRARKLRIDGSSMAQTGYTPEDFTGQVEKDYEKIKEMYSYIDGGTITRIALKSKNVKGITSINDGGFASIRSGVQEIFNLYEDEEMIEYFKFLRKINEDELLDRSRITERSAAIAQYYTDYATNDCEKINVLLSAALGEEVLLILKERYKNEEVYNLKIGNHSPNMLYIVELFAEQTEAVNAQEAVGVAEKSENKAEAFKVLELLYTDKKAENILFYGNEAGKGEFNNLYPQVLSSSWSESVIHEVYDEAMKNAEISPICGFWYFDNAETWTELAKIEAEYEGLWFGEYEDIDATLAELNAKLYEAGLQTLLDDINTQYEAWKSIK